MPLASRLILRISEPATFSSPIRRPGRSARTWLSDGVATLVARGATGAIRLQSKYTLDPRRNYSDHSCSVVFWAFLGHQMTGDDAVFDPVHAGTRVSRRSFLPNDGVLSASDYCTSATRPVAPGRPARSTSFQSRHALPCDMQGNMMLYVCTATRFRLCATVLVSVVQNSECLIALYGGATAASAGRLLR